MEEPNPYRAYLIRVWPTVRQGVAGYRVSLQSVDSGHRKDFPDLESLLDYLQAQAEENHRVLETVKS